MSSIINNATIDNTTIDKSIKDTNSILLSYSDANTYYDNIKATLNYKELLPYFEDPTMVDIGCICNSEYSSFSFNADRYWDKDAAPMSTFNSSKLINDLEWMEQSNMHNGTIQAKPGMVTLFKSADNYIADIPDCVNYFNDMIGNASGPTTDFNTYNFSNGGGGRGTAIDLFGYFHPDATGAWAFNIPSSNISAGLYTYLWVGDTALYDYTVSNANINSKTPTQVNQSVTATFTMNKDDYIPFRIQIISKNASLYNTSNVPIFTVTPPSNSAEKGTIIGNPGRGWDYFVTFIKNGAVYYKNLLYFGLVKSNADANKFDTYFVSTSSDNVKNIRDYKTYPQLQYVKVEIPIPTMTGSSVVNIQDGQPVNIGQNDREHFVSGVQITIKKAIYGMSDPTYKYTTYSTQYVDTPTNFPASTTTSIVPSKDPNIPTKEASVTTQAYTKNVSVAKQVANPPTIVSQQKDVTAQLQKMVDAAGGFKLMIDGGPNNFLNLFGNPIQDANDPYMNSTKTLLIEYTYKVDESLITDKYMFLDPNTGLINAGITFGTNGNISDIYMPISMNKSSFCSGDSCKSYSMTLSNDCRLVVNNASGNEVGYVDIKQYIQNLNIDKCLSNRLWLNNSYILSTLPSGLTTTKTSEKKIKSPDGRFKIECENKKLMLTYCIVPYSNLNIGIKYTTTSNISNTNNSQIYYLYRIKTRGLFGRKFLQETDKNTGDTIMHYIPNTHDHVLSQPLEPSNFLPLSTSPMYPLFKDGSPSFTSKYNMNTTGAKTRDACANQCISEPNNNCEHFFFVTNNDGTTRCYTDTIADSNPAFSLNKTHSNIGASNLYKKPYKIKTSCGRVDDMQPLQYIGSLGASTIDYRIPENAPDLTYYCSLDKYKQDNQNVLGTYGTATPRQKDGNNGTVSCDDYCAGNNWGGFSGQCMDTVNNDKSNDNKYKCADVPSTLLGGSLTDVSCKCLPKEGMTNMTREGMTPGATPAYNKYGPKVNTNITNRFPILNKLTKQFSDTQDQIGEQYDQTIDKLGKYEAVYQSMASPQYNYNGTDSLIPDKFQNNKNTKPNISYADGAKKDVGIMLMQQNTMYTLASIVAATCLIFSVAFTGSLE